MVCRQTIIGANGLKSGQYDGTVINDRRVTNYRTQYTDWTDNYCHNPLSNKGGKDHRSDTIESS